MPKDDPYSVPNQIKGKRYTLLGIVFTLVLLVVLSSSFASKWSMHVLLFSAVIAVLLSFRIWTCPACGGYLGRRITISSCPFCGISFKED